MNIPLFIPIIWAAALGAVALLGFGSYALFSEDPKKNKLGVLGMTASGKTRFLCCLRNIPFVEKSTSIEKYEPFIYRHDGKVIHVDAGIDIGGSDLFWNEYNRIIEKSDVIFYFLDISRYLDDATLKDRVSYRRACNSRIEHIHSAKKEIQENVVIVGTHLDLCTVDKTMLKAKFLKLNKNKSYYTILKHIEFIDLTNTNQLRNFIKKVFK